MKQLEISDRETWNNLASGETFSVTKSEVPFCGLGVDQGLEQEIRALKVSGGVVGITQNESALNRYYLIAPELLQILKSLWSQFRINVNKSKEHYQLRGTMSKRVFNRSTKMKEAIEMHIGNPFSNQSDLKEIMNIANNTLMPREHEICTRDEVGSTLYKNFVTMRLLPALGPLLSKSLWDPMKKRNLMSFVNVRKPEKYRVDQKTVELKEERSLITRFLLIQKSRPDMMKLEDAIGKYEFSAIPRSLFAGNGVILTPSGKSEFMTETELIPSPPQIEVFQHEAHFHCRNSRCHGSGSMHKKRKHSDR